MDPPADVVKKGSLRFKVSKIKGSSGTSLQGVSRVRAGPWAAVLALNLLINAEYSAYTCVRCVEG